MRLKNIICLILITYSMGSLAQDFGNIELQGSPTPLHPVWAQWDGSNQIIKLGELDITLEDVKLNKPFFGGAWELEFDLNNHTGRVLNNVEFNIAFFNKNKKLVSNIFNIGSFKFAIIGQSEIRSHKTITIPKQIWPENPKDAAFIRIGLASIIAKKTAFEKQQEEILEQETRAREKAIEDENREELRKINEEAKRVDNERLDLLIKAKEAKERKSASIAREKREKAIARQPTDYQELIRKGRICIGMNHEQVQLSWGRPSSINTTTFAYGNHEQWVYNLRSYVYFKNGIVSAIQN